MANQLTTKRIFTPVLIVLFFVGVIMLMLIYSTIRDHNTQHNIEYIKEVPEFTLIDQTGNEVTKTDLLGNFWITSFIFTNCGGSCPTMTFQKRELQNAIPPDFPVRFVSISVDPERDTPGVLRSYAEEWGADQRRWLFLTGETKNIYSLAREGFLLGVEPEGGTLREPIMHSQRFVLVDNDGMIRGYYDGFDDSELKQLKDDLFYLLAKTE